MDLPGNIGGFHSSSGGVDEEFESYGNTDDVHKPQALVYGSLSGVYGGTFPLSPPPPGPSCTDAMVAPVGAATNVTTIGSFSSAQTDQPIAGAVRGTKKRSRASRRATTTILTTDTSNFRRMVQEFTGIPGTPFPTLPSFTRPRFDPGIGSSMPSLQSTAAYLSGHSGQEKILATTPLSPFPSTGTTNITSINTTPLPNSTRYMSNSQGETSIMPSTTALPPTVNTISPLGHAANSNPYGLPMGNPTFNFPSMSSSSAAPAQMCNFPATECDADNATALITSDSLRCAGGGDDLLDMIKGWK